jgi:hypothetical protein
MKTEVYSWRVSAATKMALEREARKRKSSLSAVLETAAREWLERSAGSLKTDEEIQQELRSKAEQHFGTLSGSNPRRSEQVSELVRARVRQKYGR